MCLTASAVFLAMAFQAAALEPSGAAMIGVQAARAVKKHKEKMEEQEAEKHKLEILRARYPTEVAEY